MVHTPSPQPLCHPPSFGRNNDGWRSCAPEEAFPARRGTTWPAMQPDEIMPLKRALEDPERRIIERALVKLNGSRQKTALALDINRTTLFNKMKKYALLQKY